MGRTSATTATTSRASSASQAYAPAVLVVPDWLAAPPAIGSNLQPMTPKEMREYTDSMYSAFFETLLEKVAGGNTLTDIVREDGRYPLDKFNYWVQCHPERRARFKEAKKMASPLVEDQIINIADAINSDGTSSMEDVQRTAERLKNRWKMLAIWDRETYGTSHQIEVKNNSLRENTLEDLAGRLQDLRRKPSQIVDVVARESE